MISCNDAKELDAEVLAKVYVDLLIAEDYYKNSDSLKFKRKEVFNKYSTSEEIYDSTFKKFSYNKDKWDKFFELSNEYLDTLKSNLKSSEKQK